VNRSSEPGRQNQLHSSAGERWSPNNAAGYTEKGCRLFRDEQVKLATSYRLLLIAGAMICLKAGAAERAAAVAALPAAADAAAPADQVGEHRYDVGGVRLWYRVAGQRTGAPVIVLHGGPGEGSQTFARFAGPALEARLRMVYLDQRGSGRSDRPKQARYYSMKLLVDDIEALRRKLGAPRIDLIGHSFGTILALEYGARYPEHVAHIVLAGAVPDLPRIIDIQCARLQKDDKPAFARAAQGKRPGAYPVATSSALMRERD
jgi:predicted alpha/beta-fold hydrolase